MKTLHTIIKIPLYGDTLHLVVAKDPVLEFKKMQKSIFKELKVDDFHALSCYERSTHGIFLPLDVDFDTVIHECFHTTVHLLEYRQIKFDLNNHEAFAYFHGWLAGKIVRSMNKAGLLK